MSDPDPPVPLPAPPSGSADSSPLDPGVIDLTDTQMQAALAPEASAPARTASHGWQPPTVEELQKMLPQYEVQHFLARGGMGAVYKGCQRSLDRIVAIKILPPGVEDADVHYAERFKQEARAMAKFKHPGIVAVHDAGETPSGLLYFIMEFIEGTDVAQLVAAQGKLPVGQALSITAHVCDALAYAHSRGIVHRDIKPSNIMIESDGAVKVADFGLAKVVAQESAALTRSDMSLGTPDFIAPESIIPGLKVDARADLYAVGVMLYQMLTGHIPRGRFRLPSGIVQGIDPRLDAIVDKAMQTDREQRYATALEMKADLERLMTEAGSVAHGSADILRETGRKARAPLLIASAIVIALAASAWFFFVHHGRQIPAGPESPAEMKPSGNASVWTDWVPADLQLQGWKVEPGGVSTDLPIQGFEILPFDTRDGAARMTYLLRDASGVQISARGHVANGKHEMYVAEDEKGYLRIGRRLPDGIVQPLAGQEYPAGLTREGEHVLEFRIVGHALTATLNGTFSITAEDDNLPEGEWAMVLKKGALVKKLETQTSRKP